MVQMLYNANDLTFKVKMKGGNQKDVSYLHSTMQNLIRAVNYLIYLSSTISVYKQTNICKSFNISKDYCE